MRKNKGLFFVLAVLLAVACLLVSCNSEVASNAGGGDKLVYATFDNSGSKGTSKPESSTANISYDTVDLDSVYWVYTATKNDAGGTTGKGSHPVAISGGNPTKGLTGTIGPFSAGSWTFEIGGYKDYATTQPEGGNYVTATYTYNEEVKTVYYKDSDKVFKGTNNAVSLVSGTESQPAPIVVDIELSTEGTGTLELKSDFGFFWQEDPEASASGVPRMEMIIEGIGDAKTLLLEKVSGNIYYTLKSDQTHVWDNIDAGSYVLTVTIRYTEDISPIESSIYYTVSTFDNINVKIYSGLKTTIDSTMLEGITVYATLIPGSMASVAKASNVVADKPTTFASSFSPASPSSTSQTGGQDTTVTFPVGSLEPTGTGEGDIVEYVLTTKVSDLESVQDRGFSVTTGNSAAGSIDLSLEKVVGTAAPEPASFTGSVRIVTYIATHLADVNVKYDGEEDNPTDIQYDSETGRLSFVTTHFSEYYVTTTSEAYNSNKVKAYDTLTDAFDEVEDGETIILLKDITKEANSTQNGVLYPIDKSITLDGNGHTITDNTKSRTIRIGYNAASNPLNKFTIKNLNIINKAKYVDGNTGAIGIIPVYLKELVLDNVTIDCEYSSARYIQPLTIGTSSMSNKMKVTINGGAYSAPTGAGYSVIVSHPVDMTITNSTITGWANLYFKPDTLGSTATVVGCTMTSNGQTGATNSFGMITIEQSNVSVELTDCIMTITLDSTGTRQALANFSGWTQGQNGNNNDSVIVSGGTLTMTGNAAILVIDNGIIDNRLSITDVIGVDNYNYQTDSSNYEVAYCWQDTYNYVDYYTYVYKAGKLEDILYYYSHVCFGDKEWLFFTKSFELESSRTINMAQPGTFGLLLGDYTLSKADGVTLTIPDGVTIATDKQLGADFFTAPTGYIVESVNVPTGLPYEASYAYKVVPSST